MIPLVSHWVKIVAFDPLRRDERIVLRWGNMAFHQRTKWDWYFKYRSALMQVQHPRWEVEYTWGSEDATGKTYEQIRAQMIAIHRGKITRWENKAKALKSIIERMENDHSELWPITENPDYQILMNQMGVIVDKLHQLKITLTTL